MTWNCIHCTVDTSNETAICDTCQMWLDTSIPVGALESVITGLGIKEQDAAMDMLDHAQTTPFDQSSYDAGIAQAYKDIADELCTLLPKEATE